MTPFYPQNTLYTPAPGLISLSLPVSYRLPVCEYPLPARSNSYGSNSYGSSYSPDYNEDTPDYNLSTSFQQVASELSTSQVYGSYGNGNLTAAAKCWTATPHGQKNGLFSDSDSTSSYGHYPSRGYSLRSGSHESNNFNLIGMANALPNPNSLLSNDRMLPIPANSRTSQILEHLPHSADGLTYGHIQSNSGSTINSKPLNSPSAVIPYIDLSSSSPDSPPSYPVSGMQASVGQSQLQDHYSDKGGQQQNHGLYSPKDMYSPIGSHEAWPSNSLPVHEPTLRTHGSSSDLYNYGPGVDGARKNSHGGHGTTVGSLVNGMQYVPYPGPEEIPRIPSMDMTHHAATHRASVNSLRGT